MKNRRWLEAAAWWAIFALGAGGRRWVFPHPDRAVAWILRGGQEADLADTNFLNQGR